MPALVHCQRRVCLFFLLLAASSLSISYAFFGIKQQTPSTKLFQQQTTQSASQSSILEQDTRYAECFKIIDECSVSGQPSEDLYDSVRYIDKKAFKLYPTDEAKSELWNRAHGSWKLQLATGGGRFNTFKPVPIFAFAMIDEHNFGNGVGLNEDTIILSLLGPHYFKRRQMGIGIENMYLFSNKVNPPGFVADSMGLGKTPEDYKTSKSRMPTFTMIGASDKSLIARGGTGGIAIWTRLEKDIRPAAYGK